MGTKVHCKSYLPGYYSMRNLNEDSSSSSWPACYGDKAMTNGQYYNGFMPRTITGGYPGYEKDALKQKMLEHEAVFKNQVYELHRLYRIQRDMMEEVKRKELYGVRASMEPSSSSSHRGSQVPSEATRKWHMAGFPLSHPGYDRTPVSRVEIVNSPMSCTKGNSMQPGNFPFQNGSSLKDSEPLDSRPLKVRKKLFDLQLPADEYIDAEEDKKLPECNVKSEAESSMKLSNGGHADCRVDVSASASHLRNSIRLADLNEPIEIEEATAPSSVDFLGHSCINGETKGVNQPAKLNAGHLGVQETGFFINSSIESKVNERGRLSHLYEAGSSKSNLSSVTYGLWQDKLPILSHPVQGMFNRVDHGPGTYPTGHNREDPWRERNHHVLESSNRSRADCSNCHFPPLVSSQAPGSEPFFSSCFASSWANSVSCWAKPTSSFTQKITTFESCLNSAAATGRSLQTSAQSQEPFGGKWPVGSRLNPCLGSELTTVNGFYQGSASGSKELKFQLPSAGLDQRFGYFPNGSNRSDSKPAIDLNLNEVVSKSSSKEVVILEDLTSIDGKSKPKDHISGLPWLKRELVHANEAATQSYHKNEIVTDLNQPFTPKVMLASSDCEIVTKKEVETQNVKKILGFPIFETVALKQEPESHIYTLASVGCPPEGNGVDKERKNRIIDINLECEPDDLPAAEELTVEKQKERKGDSIRDYIDLNSCISDCEDPSAPSYESKTASVKKPLEIDLEAPAPLENEEDNTLSKENTMSELKHESLKDEVLRNAAETIVVISSSCPNEDSVFHPLEACLAESLLWFVDALSSCADELESTSCNELTVRDGSRKDVYEEIDDFEAMTLQLPETKEEDYMPVPFVPEVQIVDDIGASTLPTRPRRGQSRRGRQRRDFQRDILPGLASLSRHEVTEDLQTFGGLMRAMGHHWVSGLTRRNGTRNGGTRGRRRAVVEAVSTPSPSPVCTPLIQQLNSIEAGLEDRSLTGWGKTTRRPRRQRCPAGNPPAVVLT